MLALYTIVIIITALVGCRFIHSAWELEQKYYATKFGGKCYTSSYVPKNAKVLLQFNTKEDCENFISNASFTDVNGLIGHGEGLTGVQVTRD